LFHSLCVLFAFLFSYKYFFVRLRIAVHIFVVELILTGVTNWKIHLSGIFVFDGVQEADILLSTYAYACNCDVFIITDNIKLFCQWMVW